MRAISLTAVLLFAVGCSSTMPEKCSALTCSGCCDMTGTCQFGTTEAACGTSGLSCSSCIHPQTCSAGFCVNGATGGGSGTTGGGSGSTGGGSGTTGGGTGSTCNAQTCPDGCCDGDTCRAGTALARCGTGGSACRTCANDQTCSEGVCTGGSCNATNCPDGCCQNGACVAGNSASACGTGGAACDACAANESCNGRSCVASSGTCNATSCPDGCCQGNVCVGGSNVNACGRNGTQCATCASGQSCNNGACVAPTCNSTSCPSGCCDGNVCLPGSSTSACGRGGVQCTTCAAGQTCNGASCVSPSCNSTNCPSGCCVNNTCVAPTSQQCGTNGAQCNACASGQNCSANGQCVSGASCNSSTCPTGCCDGNVCLAGNTGASCGSSGNACTTCGSGLSCVSGQCVAPVCNATTCPTGCCSGSICMTGNSINACGTGGAACGGCLSGDVCSNGTCINSCNSQSCPTGCCSGNSCVSGTSANACGISGNACSTCSSGQSCNGGSCSTGTQTGDACSNAPTVSLPHSGSYSLVGYANDFTSQTNGCRGSQGLDRMVRFQVPAGHRVSATVTPTVNTFDAQLSLVAGSATACVGSATCVGSSDIGFDNDPETATWINTTGASAEVFAIVDDFDVQSLNGAYTLSISSAPPPAGDTCGTAITGTSGVAITRTPSDFTTDYGTATGCSTPYTGPDLVIVYSVPANQSLTINAVPTSNLDVSVNLSIGSAACTSRMCSVGSGRGGAGVTETVGWNNTTGATQNVFVVIDTPSTPSGSVTVTGTIGAALACGPLTCATGCCSGNACQPGTNNSQCGGNGAACSACASPAVCSSSQTCSATNLPTGAPCTAASQCYQPFLGGAECRTSWPSGYCSGTCLLINEVCGGFGSSATGWCTSNAECLQTCTGPGSGQSTCRANYVCDAAPGTPTQGVCVPRCPTVACATGTTCNAQGYCR